MQSLDDQIKSIITAHQCLWDFYTELFISFICFHWLAHAWISSTWVGSNSIVCSLAVASCHCICVVSPVGVHISKTVELFMSTSVIFGFRFPVGTGSIKSDNSWVVLRKLNQTFCNELGLGLRIIRSNIISHHNSFVMHPSMDWVIVCLLCYHRIKAIPL